MKAIIVDRLEKALPWSLIGILITIVISIPSIYLSIREKRPEVTIDIVSESNVLDIHKALSNLSILYRGEDIQKERLNLRIFTINVVNTGQTDIRQGDFDEEQPWGIQIDNATAVE